MDFDSWVLLVGAFWLGTLSGFGACALMQVARRADAQRARQVSSLSFPSDLQSDTITRF